MTLGDGIVEMGATDSFFFFGGVGFGREAWPCYSGGLRTLDFWLALWFFDLLVFILCSVICCLWFL